MITFPTLGTIGRLGNHLFQIAATIGHARDRGQEFRFPRWIHEKDFQIQGCFFEEVPEGEEYEELHFHYDPIPPRTNLSLSGFFQSEKYFANCREEIRRLLTPKKLPPFTTFRGVASVQVRRGDYLELPDRHPILGREYYEQAVSYLEDRGVTRFMVFSDDLPWCREHFEWPPFQVVPDLSPIDQFVMSISCEHHIMANSTFSWWSAWLDPNPGKIVIAPKLWFGPAYAHFDTKDLIPEPWLIM